ncbi:MAG: glycosyltransferase [Sedimentisphaerales bacterium]|nr:glycosyltransferase [Sedimentisphaerales bacterium]
MQIAQETKTAVLIPCYNEELTIGKVVDDFKEQLPLAAIYVFDNSSTDASAAIAARHGARVIREPRQGKGFVIDCMFDTIDADLYVMVDGDDTYPADYVHKLLEPLHKGQADMVVGARLSQHSEKSFRSLHVFGNNLVRRLVNLLCGTNLTDIMSGYRAFTRRVVDRTPLVSAGFEVETEMTIQVLYLQMKIVEVNIPYSQRPPGSVSKLRTFSDGFRVLWQIFCLFRAVKPLTFFGGMGIIFMILGILAGIPPINDYLNDPKHYVYHVPLAILATGLMILSAGCFFIGILLHALNWRFRELNNVLTRRSSTKKHYHD